MRNVVLQLPGGDFAVVSMRVVEDLSMAGDGSPSMRARDPQYVEVSAICAALLHHSYASKEDANHVINRAGGATDRA